MFRVRRDTRQIKCLACLGGPPPFGMQPNQDAYGADFQRAGGQYAELQQPAEIFSPLVCAPDRAAGRNQTCKPFLRLDSKHDDVILRRLQTGTNITSVTWVSCQAGSFDR